MTQIDPEKIGYYGRPITKMTREELLNAFIDLVLVIQDCTKKDGKCKDVLNVAEHSNNERC